MKLNYEISIGEFIKRPNRFIAHVKLGNEEVICHVPNTGRCGELLIQGVEVLLSYHPDPHRRTKYELRMVKKNREWVSIDSQIPNKVALEAIKNGVIKELQGYETIKTESKYGNSRFDIKLEGEQDCYVEIKGVTLEINEWGYFPDAPTSRGRKHVEELIDVVKKGYRGVILFIVQHEKIKGVSPNVNNDPKFSESIERAQEEGVEILVYKCMISPEEIKIIEKLPFSI